MSRAVRCHPDAPIESLAVTPSSHPRSRLITAALVSVVALSGCGNAFDAPAAIVAGTEISQDQLAHELQVLLRQPQFAQQVQGPTGADRKKEFTRQLLALLIEQRVVDRYAMEHRGGVTTTEIEQTLAQVVQQQGGQSQFDAALARLGLTVDEVRDNIRLSLLGGKVRTSVAAARFGPNASQQQQDQAFSEWKAAQFREGGVEVNPRFGRFDPSKGSVCRIDSTSASTSCAQA
jgi:SurA-like protein